MYEMTAMNAILTAVVFAVVIAVFAVAIRRELK